MKRKRVIVRGLMMFLATLSLVWFGSKALRYLSANKTQTSLASQSDIVLSSSSSQSSLALAEEYDERLRQEKRRKMIDRIEATLETPITFYGKVVDQNASPIPDARVGYSLLDKFAASGSSDHKFSDSMGTFEISGVKGAAITIKVSKNGYYPIPGLSYQSFAYGLSANDYMKSPPSKKDPSIFILHKMGHAERLIELSSRQFEIPKTGKPVFIDLATGQVGQSGLQVSLKIDEARQSRFDWSFELSVAEGGLVERVGSFAFEAPLEGYEKNILVGMKASDPAWKMSAEKSYFVKLPEGKYARIHVRFYPRLYRSIIVLESYLNPSSGSRNLEFDMSQDELIPTLIEL